ncbi:type II secretion system protein GspK [Hydrogenobacter hydrogenophilus]|uniref:General secretion pathway protein K n=1 Tax=Hydrogenobacter hydrogenophilus TaxID=35835 RepID=A0A285NSE6_9AQUI|nr:type II secretion system protein GspK [Hydrogenobacter hydrogenophilus]SNZ12108.1 general secretion pathway protein K [Hydrogenobacter hydrogenophilus]
MRGSIIVYVLWMVTLLSGLVFFTLYQLRYSYMRTSHFVDNWTFLYEARALAVLGVNTVQKNPSLLRIKSPIPYYISNRKYRIYIYPEEAKISLPLANSEILKSLMMRLGVEEKRAVELSQNIMAFLGRGVSKQGTPAPYRDVFSITELFYVDGMDRNTYEKLQNYLTPVATLTNINYAPEPVLLALGLTESEAKSVEEQIKVVGYINPEWLQNLLGPSRLYISLRFVYTPLPMYYRVKVVKYEPYYDEMDFIVTSYGEVLDAWQE